MPSATITKIGKVTHWGNSLGLRIPQDVARKLGLKDGGGVSIEAKNGAMTIRPAKPKTKRRKKWTEAELLKGITPAMCGPDLIPNRAGKELI